MPPRARRTRARSATDATDPDSDPLSFSKLAGPAWLTVASGGALSGTPGGADMGLNTFTVQVADGRGGIARAVLQITVVDPGTANSARIA